MRKGSLITFLLSTFCVFRVHAYCPHGGNANDCLSCLLGFDSYNGESASRANGSLESVNESSHIPPELSNFRAPLSTEEENQQAYIEQFALSRGWFAKLIDLNDPWAQRNALLQQQSHTFLVGTDCQWLIISPIPTYQIVPRVMIHVCQNDQFGTLEEQIERTELNSILAQYEINCMYSLSPATTYQAQ